PAESGESSESVDAGNAGDAPQPGSKSSDAYGPGAGEPSESEQDESLLADAVVVAAEQPEAAGERAGAEHAAVDGRRGRGRGGRRGRDLPAPPPHGSRARGDGGASREVSLPRCTTPRADAPSRS